MYIYIYTHTHTQKVSHKAVKHFNNSQQIDHATDRGNSYADREKNSPTLFFTYFTDAQYIRL
jgi:hypothetical protein